MSSNLQLLGRNHRWKRFFAGDEFHRDRIDAVARVLSRQSFALEDMSKMTTAIMANDFGAVAVGVLVAIDRTRDLVIKARPTAMTVELVLGLVKRRIALSADKRPRIPQFCVLAGKGRLGAFAD